MAHYVLSDVHGEWDRFRAMLETIRFSQDDLLYILGDVVDRGPEPISLLTQVMRTPNIRMILGNHEHMCLRYHSPDATQVDVRRWGKNGNGTTLAGLAALTPVERKAVLDFLKTLPVHLTVQVNGKSFYLVHGFPGENLHDSVWGRPKADTPNPVPGFQVIVGHTPVLYMEVDDSQEEAYLRSLEQSGRHMRIFHAPGFIDIDCGCGHNIPGKALACLRLEDMAEFYT